MNQKELDEILELHRKWLNGDLEGVEANLRGADLQEADLRGANLQEADLREADLREANLQGANLRGANLQEADLREADLLGADLREADIDYSCWPIWCGSLDVRVDKRIAVQLAYHFCRLDCDDPEYLAMREALKDFANQFHRVDECGKIE